MPASAVARRTPAMAGRAGYDLGASGETACDILLGPEAPEGGAVREVPGSKAPVKVVRGSRRGTPLAPPSFIRLSPDETRGARNAERRTIDRHRGPAADAQDRGEQRGERWPSRRR